MLRRTSDHVFTALFHCDWMDAHESIKSIDHVSRHLPWGRLQDGDYGHPKRALATSLLVSVFVVFWCPWIARAISPTRKERWAGCMFDRCGAACSETAFSVSTSWKVRSWTMLRIPTDVGCPAHFFRLINGSRNTFNYIEWYIVCTLACILIRQLR